MLFNKFFFRLGSSVIAGMGCHPLLPEGSCRHNALVAKILPTKFYDGDQMANFWRFFASCISASRMQHVSDIVQP